MIRRGVLGYLLVLAGGLVVAVVPASSPVTHAPVVGALRATMPGRMLGLAVVVAGLGLAAAAWLRLLRYVGRGDRSDLPARLLLVRRATVLWSLPLLLAPPMFSRDGWSYAAQGEMTRLGISPYLHGPAVLHGPIVEAVDPRWMHTLTPYGPVPLLWGAAAAHLTTDPWLLVVGYRLLALAGLAMLAWAVPRLAARAGRDPALVSAVVLPSPLMLAHGVAGVHNDVVMAGLMALALVVAIEHGWLLGAVLGGLAAAVKLPAGLVCIGVVLVSLPVAAAWPQRVRRLVAVGAVAVGTMVAAGLVAGLGVGWVHALGVPGEVQTPFSLTTQAGRLLDLLLGWSDVAAVERVDGVALARAAGSVAAVLVAGRVAMRAPTGVPAGGVRAAALVMVAVVALSPVVHHWYALWFLPLLATCHLGARATSALVAFSWLAGLVAPLDSSLEGNAVAIVVAVVLVGGVAATQVVGHRAATRRIRLAPAPAS